MKNKTIVFFLLMNIITGCMSNKVYSTYRIDYLESGYSLYVNKIPELIPEDMNIYKLNKYNHYKLIQKIKE